MALHIKDSKTDKLVREFAKMRGVGITEAIYAAVAEAIAAHRNKHAPDVAALKAKLQPLMAEMKTYGPLPSLDKRFLDDLHDEPHGDFSQTDMA